MITFFVCLALLVTAYFTYGRYLERVFPAAGVRFIAVGDQVDSLQGRYDMLLPIRANLSDMPRL